MFFLNGFSNDGFETLSHSQRDRLLKDDQILDEIYQSYIIENVDETSAQDEISKIKKTIKGNSDALYQRFEMRSLNNAKAISNDALSADIKVTDKNCFLLRN